MSLPELLIVRKRHQKMQLQELMIYGDNQMLSALFPWNKKAGRIWEKWKKEVLIDF